MTKFFPTIKALIAFLGVGEEAKKISVTFILLMCRFYILL